MALSRHFYHALIRKHVAVFGTMFNNIKISRQDASGDNVQKFVVPIAYGPWPKYVALAAEDPKQEKRRAISLPRMSYEITNINYDPERKVASGAKEWRCSTDGITRVLAGTPYTIDFNLYIMVKYAEDGAKIVEQIFPFFTPAWTSSVRLITDMQPVDIPTILNSVSMEDTYENDFQTRRVMIWTLSFQMKTYMFGPAVGPNHGNEDGTPWDPDYHKRKVIKFIDVSTFGQTEANPSGSIHVYPGLTEDGNPTTDPTQTIPWTEINASDDWDTIISINHDLPVFDDNDNDEGNGD